MVSPKKPPVPSGPTPEQLAAALQRAALHARVRGQLLYRDQYHEKTREAIETDVREVVELLLDEDMKDLAAAWRLNMFGLDVTSAGVVVVPIHSRVRRTVANAGPFLAGGQFL